MRRVRWRSAAFKSNGRDGALTVEVDGQHRRPLRVEGTRSLSRLSGGNAARSSW
jgi:hypothetical protein